MLRNITNLRYLGLHMPLVLQPLSKAGGENEGLAWCGDVRAETATGQKGCRTPLGLDGSNASQSSLDLCFLTSTHNISPVELDLLVRPEFASEPDAGREIDRDVRGPEESLRRNVGA